jgi:hypothetical protein
VTGLLWAAVGVLGGLGMTALGDMVSEEVRDRLDHLPHAILRLAARRLDPLQRVMVYEDEWLPELIYILKGDEARPITRLVHGVGYALGILVAAHRITGNLRQRLVENVLDEQIALAQMVLAGAQARLRDVEAAQADQPVLDRLHKELAGDEQMLENLVELRHLMERLGNRYK